MQIKVKRIRLIRELEAERDRRIKRAAKSANDFPAQFAAYRASVIGAIKKAMNIAEKAQTLDDFGAISDRYNEHAIKIPTCKTETPKKAQTCEIDEYLRVLGMAEDEIITLGTTDAWLRPLANKCK